MLWDIFRQGLSYKIFILSKNCIYQGQISVLDIHVGVSEVGEVLLVVQHAASQYLASAVETSPWCFCQQLEQGDSLPIRSLTLALSAITKGPSTCHTIPRHIWGNVPTQAHSPCKYCCCSETALTLSTRDHFSSEFMWFLHTAGLLDVR